jgi:hypothetical protein
MFPSLGILQHYVEFNIHGITTLEKLLGAFLVVLPVIYLVARPLFLLLWVGLAFVL